MSYILDALKKSEEKRGSLQVPLAPSVAAPLGGVAKRRFIWPFVLVVAALIAGWLFAQWQKPDNRASMEHLPLHAYAVAEAEDVAAIAEVHLQANRLKTGNVEQTVSVTSSKHIEPASNELVAYVKEQAIVSTPITPASVMSEQSIGSHQVKNDQALVEHAVVPSLNELTMQEQQSMPAINIEGHIYDIEPSARMVIINGKVRKEKHTISTGLLLQEITPDGVIMNYQGRVFHMGVFDRQ